MSERTTATERRLIDDVFSPGSIAEGQVAECWPNTDDLGLLHTLGVVPQPGRIVTG